MEIVPIAFDSMGVRSMATFVKTKDVTITIDPSVSLAPSRYGLPPHKIEIEQMEEKWREIKGFVEKSDVIIITHYHYDHHNPEEVEIFEGKKLLLKHPKDKINRSQIERAEYFLERLRNVKVEIDFCDGKKYEFGNTFVEISKPVFHGANQKLGFVLEVFVSDGKNSFLFSSDVEGPLHADQTEFILQRRPEIVFIDGPMSYMLGYRFSKASLEKAVENLKKISEVSREIVLDHHLLRDINWRNQISELFVHAEQFSTEIKSAAEFRGVEENLLEARRKELYERFKF
ncbi:MAG: MBL fold metallo-hydrolase [Archaeoglobus sp.]|jgi:predicted metallo-beta-lactamase superfamily hydrolase|nr:MBL fold metallo-hydrolase [Archaeoglobus sp.]